MGWRSAIAFASTWADQHTSGSNLEFPMRTAMYGNLAPRPQDLFAIINKTPCPAAQQRRQPSGPGAGEAVTGRHKPKARARVQTHTNPPPSAMTPITALLGPMHLSDIATSPNMANSCCQQKNILRPTLMKE